MAPPRHLMPPHTTSCRFKASCYNILIIWNLSTRLSGLTHVIWLEGINDIGAGTTTDSIIAGYQNVVGRLHAKGIKVYGATLTSALGISGLDMGDNGPGHDASRWSSTPSFAAPD